MLETVLAAFVMGAIGSFHCVGMCGPLALALPLHDNSLQAKFIGTLLYNGGRIFTYSILGFAAGLLGKSFALFGFQQWLSVILGVTIVLFVLLPKLVPSFFKQANTGTGFFEKIRHIFGTLFFKKNPSTLFAIGVLNGLLPCGLVYLAIAGATATGGNIINSILFMAAFGAGTLPVMWSIAFWGNFIGIRMRQKIRTAYPYMMLLMACLLILRGMGLGIPYISPEADVTKKAMSCFAKP